MYHVGSFFRWTTSSCRQKHGDQDNDDDGPGLPVYQQEPKQEMNQLTRPPPAVIMTTK